MSNCIKWLENINKAEVLLVADKDASLGEALSHFSERGINVPSGFATTTYAFKEFLDFNNLSDWIEALLFDLNVNNVHELVKTGQTIRQKILEGSLPDEFAQEVNFAYRTMLKNSLSLPSVTVQAAATDSGDALLAGQDQVIENIKGVNNIFAAIKRVYASLYNDRAIAQRMNKNISHEHAAISAKVQYFDIFAKPGSGDKKVAGSEVAEYVQLGYYSPTQRFTAVRK